MLEFLTILVSVSLCSSVTVLSCQRLQLLNESTICPSDPVSCECRGVESLFWVVVSQTADPVFQASVINRTLTMVPTDGFTVVLSNVTVEPLGGQFMRTTLTSKLTVLSMEDVTVECRDNGGPNTVFLQRASKSSHDRMSYLPIHYCIFLHFSALSRSLSKLFNRWIFTV